MEANEDKHADLLQFTAEACMYVCMYVYGHHI